MNVSQQIRFAKNIVQKMNKDIRFKKLQPTILKLNIKIQEWQIAITNAKSGGKFKAIKKIEKGLTVRDLIFQLAAEIEILAKDDEKAIVASGAFGWTLRRFWVGRRKLVREENPMLIAVKVGVLAISNRPYVGEPKDRSEEDRDRDQSVPETAEVGDGRCSGRR